MKWLSIFAGFILLLGVLPSWPYDYYIFLRWAVFIASILVAWELSKLKESGWVLAFGTIAFLFNPIFPVYLSRPSWIPLDFIGAILFFVGGVAHKTYEKN